jgi:hypothetical protein
MLRLAFALLCLTSLAHADTPTGVITGNVGFEGELPAQPEQKRDSDPKCPQHVTDDAVVVNKGKLANVLVRIQNGTMGQHDAPKEPVVLDQNGCSYSPRVVGMIAGQKLVVRNSDKTFHNVWGVIAGGKELWNKPQGPGAEELKLDPSAAKPGDVVELKCGVHGWMHAYAVVQDHPYFAVTGADGKFEIKGLPIGKYTLEAWHPVFGKKTLQVEIGKGARGKVNAHFGWKPNDLP